MALADSVKQLKGEDVFQFFVNAYTNAVDPHTDYFTPRTAETFNQQMSLSLEGIGAQLQKQDDMVVIREVIPGGPAAVDGTLKPGDRIVGVGQAKTGTIEDVIGWRIDDVVAKIRGSKDTQVRLEYIPAESGIDGKHRTVTLTRQKVRLAEQAAKGETITLPGTGSEPQRRIGIIKLPGFYQDFEGRRRNATDYASATRDVAKLLAGFKSDKVDGVVLDLRNNGGGSLDEAIELTGLFIEQGPVVQVRESGGRVTVNGDSDPKVAWDGPLGVLINRGSASASEIFAGAIQDYGRGLVIGETSFGKGTVQNIVDLDRWPAAEGQRYGQVKLTIRAVLPRQRLQYPAQGCGAGHRLPGQRGCHRIRREHLRQCIAVDAHRRCAAYAVRQLCAAAAEAADPAHCAYRHRQGIPVVGRRRQAVPR